MPKISYICPSRHYVRVENADPDNAFRCPECAAQIPYHGGAAIHSSEAVVVFRGPEGEIRIPGSADSPMARKYAEHGFTKEIVNTHTGLRELEKATGLRHERSNYDQNSAQADRYYAGDPPRRDRQPVGIFDRDGKLKILNRPR